MARPFEAKVVDDFVVKIAAKVDDNLIPNLLQNLILLHSGKIVSNYNISVTEDKLSRLDSFLV